MSLAGAVGAGGKGVEFDRGAPMPRWSPARALARKTGAVVAVTGEIDYATDGDSDDRGRPAATR